MVWNEINGGSFRFDDALMESLFSYETASKNSTNISSKSTLQGNSNSGQSAQTFILDPRNSQNWATVLKSLAVYRKEILEALLDGRGLDVDTLENLTRLPNLDSCSLSIHSLQHNAFQIHQRSRNIASQRRSANT